MMNQPAPGQVDPRSSITDADRGKWPDDKAGQILGAADKLGQRQPVQMTLDKLAKVIFGDRGGMLDRAEMYLKMQKDFTDSIADFEKMSTQITMYWEGDAADAFQSSVRDYESKCRAAQTVISDIIRAFGSLAQVVSQTWLDVIKFLCDVATTILDAVGGMLDNLESIATGVAAEGLKAIGKFIQDADAFVEKAVHHMEQEQRLTRELRDAMAKLEAPQFDAGVTDITSWKLAK